MGSSPLLHTYLRSIAMQINKVKLHCDDKQQGIDEKCDENVKYSV